MSNLFYEQLEKESKPVKYDKEYTIEEALKMASEFGEYLDALIEKFEAEECVNLGN